MRNLKIGKFAKSYNQNKFVELQFKNEYAKVYIIKLVFRRYLLLTIPNKN